MSSRVRKPAGAFTLLELLAAVTIIAILASLLLSAVSATKQKAQRIHCLNNNKQLITAWLMFGHENEDELAPNVDGVDGLGVFTNWVAGTMSRASDATNAALLVDPRQSLIANYINDSGIFKCPADKSPLVRSFSLNYRMNPVRYGGQPVFTQGMNSNYQTFRKSSEIQRPQDIFVMIDERSDSINDAYFVVDNANTGGPDGAGTSQPYYIIDYPASYHAGSSTISFADGHGDSHKWLESTTNPPLGKAHPRSYTSAGDRDMKWLQDHCTYPLKGSE